MIHHDRPASRRQLLVTGASAALGLALAPRDAHAQGAPAQPAQVVASAHIHYCVEARSSATAGPIAAWRRQHYSGSLTSLCRQSDKLPCTSS